MPDKKYTSEDIAMLLEHMKGKNSPGDSVSYAPQEIDALMGAASRRASMPEPLPLEPGESVMKSSVPGLPPGSRVVSTPTQVYEPRPMNRQAAAPPMQMQNYPGVSSDPQIQKRNALFDTLSAELAGRKAKAAYGSENWDVRPLPQAKVDPMRTQMLEAVERGDINRYDQLDAVRRGDVGAYDRLSAEPSALDYLLSRSKGK